MYDLRRMHIKIFFDDRPLFLCDSVDDEVAPYLEHRNTIKLDGQDLSQVKSIISGMQQSSTYAGVAVHKDFDLLCKTFLETFKIVQAGGGLVKNAEGSYLLIHRRGKWDLPKGKLDEGETIEECAVREVEEETGITNITLGKPLLVTRHVYKYGVNKNIKESHWYHMSIDDRQVLVPQTEEDITEAKWVPATELDQYLDGAYPSIVDVLKASMIN